MGSLLLLVCGLQESTVAVRLPCQRLLAAESSWGSAILRRDANYTCTDVSKTLMCMQTTWGTWIEAIPHLTGLWRGPRDFSSNTLLGQRSLVCKQWLVPDRI